MIDLARRPGKPWWLVKKIRNSGGLSSTRVLAFAIPLSFQGDTFLEYHRRAAARIGDTFGAIVG